MQLQNQLEWITYGLILGSDVRATSRKTRLETHFSVHAPGLCKSVVLVLGSCIMAGTNSSGSVAQRHTCEFVPKEHPTAGFSFIVPLSTEYGEECTRSALPLFHHPSSGATQGLILSKETGVGQQPPSQDSVAFHVLSCESGRSPVFNVAEFKADFLQKLLAKK